MSTTWLNLMTMGCCANAGAAARMAAMPMPIPIIDFFKIILLQIKPISLQPPGLYIG